MSDKKSYYAFIPAIVRYDTELSYAARLMYGEVSALCNEKGYCWATNSYFADLYEVEERTIRRWISLLAEKGHLKIQLEGSKRRLYLSCAFKEDQNVHPDNSVPLAGQSSPPYQDKKVHQNIKPNTKGNTTTTIDGSYSTPAPKSQPPAKGGGGSSKFDMEYLGSQKLTEAQLRRIEESGNWTKAEIQEMLDYFAFDVQEHLLTEKVLGHAETFTRVLAKGSPWKKPPNYIHPQQKQELAAKKRKYQEHAEQQAAAVKAAKEAQDAVFQPAFERWRNEFDEEAQYQMALKKAGAVPVRREHKNNITQLLRNCFRETDEWKAIAP